MSGVTSQNTVSIIWKKYSDTFELLLDRYLSLFPGNLRLLLSGALKKFLKNMFGVWCYVPSPEYFTLYAIYFLMSGVWVFGTCIQTPDTQHCFKKTVETVALLCKMIAQPFLQIF